MRLSDLSTEDNDSGHCTLNHYDKIESLLNTVGCLKSESKVKMQKGECQMAKRFLEEQKEELEEVAHELAETEHENRVLKHNIERIKEEKDFTMLQKKHLQQEKECLMSKLAEAEMDGAAATKQVMDLKDTVGKLTAEKQMTCTDINTLMMQKELLLQKVSTFAETNHTLRDLLREQQCKEVSWLSVLRDQAPVPKSEACGCFLSQHLLLLLQDKDKEVEELLQELQCDKAQAKTASELSKSMESLRGHLQAQLQCKEAEIGRLSLQIKSLEQHGNQHKAEVEAMMEQLKELKQKGDRDKETLKKAIRAQKERAEKSEEYAEQLHVQLADKDLYVSESLSTLDSRRSHYNQVVKDKGDLELEIIVLNGRVADLLNQQHSLEEKMREDRDSLAERLHRQTAEISAFKLENERLKARRQFQSQLADLQQQPDILKITEAKLAERQDQLQGYERKNIDLTAIISDLRSRIYYLGLCSERQKQASPLFRSNLSLSYWNHISRLHLSKPSHTSYFFV
ncbi:Outer dense fiber protein 2 [Lemmus lemmus]